MYIHRIVKKWDNHEAKHYFELQQFQPFDPNHSCYGCYDSWKKQRQKCHQNGPRWDYKATGDREWAARIIKQYSIPSNMLMVEMPGGVTQFTMKVGLA